MSKLYELPGHLIRRLQQIAVSAFIAEVSAVDGDLTPVQYAALRVLSETPNIDQVTLAGLIAHDKTTIGGVISRLERRNLLKRVVSPEDRRARTLRLTKQGESLLQSVSKAVDRAQDVMLTGLSESERAKLLTLLRKATHSGNSMSRAPLRPRRPERQNSR